ncbi:hypothetical protein DVW07_09845 [Clostridium botulinum]|uniref:hypothetical protein n=2 Tax=Clostridium botulinum TaxID=1491 RepID=UPI001966D71C|nr:hypothetical protein [Clostridium botulinum]MBN1042361.1 hypothetical protein [Clostridium botulinum]
MRTSTNYGFKLPEGTDNVKRQDFVDNFEKIDRELKNNDTQVKDIAKKTDKFTEDSNGKLLYNNDKVGATKAKELELETISGMNAKDVQAGIAEVFQGANNFISYKQGIAGVVGSPVTGTQNKDEAVNSIQGIKNNAASALKSKNVDASGNEALASLVGKINNINIEGMGGIRCKFETIYYTSGKLTINTDFDIAVAIISLIDSVSRQTCFIAGEPNYITCTDSGWYSSYSSSTGGCCNSNCFGLVNSRSIYFSPNNNRYENRNIKVFIIGKVGN